MMTNEQRKVFEEVALQCVSDSYSRINVASKKRRDAIIAAYEHIDDLRGALQATLSPLEAAENILVSPDEWRGVGPVVELLEKALVAIREELNSG